MGMRRELLRRGVGASGAAVLPGAAVAVALVVAASGGGLGGLSSLGQLVSGPLPSGTAPEARERQKVLTGPHDLLPRAHPRRAAAGAAGPGTSAADTSTATPPDTTAPDPTAPHGRRHESAGPQQRPTHTPSHGVTPSDPGTAKPPPTTSTPAPPAPSAPQPPRRGVVDHAADSVKRLTHDLSPQLGDTTDPVIDGLAKLADSILPPRG